MISKNELIWEIYGHLADNSIMSVFCCLLRENYKKEFDLFCCFYIVITQIVTFLTHISWTDKRDLWEAAIMFFQPATLLKKKLRHRCFPVNFAKFLTILTGNMCFTEFSTKIHWNTRLATSDVFHMFTQSVKFF